MNFLAITIGLPLSGKSSFCKEMQKEGYVVVCPDTIRLAMHGGQFNSLAEPYVWAVAETMTRSLLREGHSVIIDATNTTLKRRRFWKKVAEEEKAKLIGFWVETPVEECLKRNEQLKRLDPAIIHRMAEQFEQPWEVGNLRSAGSGLLKNSTT